MITWQQYANRRNVDITSWIRANNIVDYEGFVDVCKGKGVLPPTKNELSSYFGEQVASIEPVKGDTKKVKSAPVNEPVIIREPVPDSIITPSSEPDESIEPVESVEQETVAEDSHPPSEEEITDPSDMGVYVVDDEGFLVAKQQPSTKKVFTGGHLRSSGDLDDK